MAPSSWPNAPLTSFDLEAAFQHYFDDKLTHEDWIEPVQLEVQSKHDIVERLVDALQQFRSPDSGGKQPVYSHAKVQAVLAAQTTSSPGPGKAPPSPQPDPSPSSSTLSEQTHQYQQPNPSAAYHQNPNPNYQPAVQTQNYAQDSQGFNQRQQGPQPYVQAQGHPNFAYAPDQQRATTPHPPVSILVLLACLLEYRMLLAIHRSMDCICMEAPSGCPAWCDDLPVVLICMLSCTVKISL